MACAIVWIQHVKALMHLDFLRNKASSKIVARGWGKSARDSQRSGSQSSLNNLARKEMVALDSRNQQSGE